MRLFSFIAKRLIHSPGHVAGYALRYPSRIFSNMRLKHSVLSRELKNEYKDNFLEHIVARTTPVFFLEDALPSASLPPKEKILESASYIQRHLFNFLGSGFVNFGPTIDWHKDYATDSVWPKVHSSRIIFSYEEGGRDVKSIWEPSRFYQGTSLGAAYRVSGDNSYVKEFMDQVSSWIAENPFLIGMNWRNTMEIAIRVCNWICCWYFFLPFFKSNISDPEVRGWTEKFFGSVNDHGKFIVRNLETRPVRSNHYIAGLAGLVYAGTLFPEFKESARWLKRGQEGLESEMEYQVYKDGVDYESSISYHRLVTELFGYAALLCKLNNVTLSDYFWSKLKKMFEFARYYTKPNGLAPQIGDNDDGRLHLLFEDYYNWDKRDHRHLFWLYEQLFEEVGLPRGSVTSKSFPDAGIYIMRNDRLYCIVDCGPNGQGGNGGHAHNDTLSFELNVGGNDFIIDPGAYIYTADPEARNRFRGTEMHNTVMIDGEEQNRFVSETLFALSNDAIPKVNKWESNEKFDYLDGEHSGYARLPNPIVHRRVFHFDKEGGALEFFDVFAGSGQHAFEWNFHLAPGVAIVERSGSEIELVNGGVRILLEAPDDFVAYVYDSEYSPSYGVKVPAKAIRFFLQGDAAGKEFRFVFRLL